MTESDTLSESSLEARSREVLEAADVVYRMAGPILNQITNLRHREVVSNLARTLWARTGGIILSIRSRQVPEAYILSRAYSELSGLMILFCRQSSASIEEKLEEYTLGIPLHNRRHELLNILANPSVARRLFQQDENAAREELLRVDTTLSERSWKGLGERWKAKSISQQVYELNSSPDEYTEQNLILEMRAFSHASAVVHSQFDGLEYLAKIQGDDVLSDQALHTLLLVVLQAWEEFLQGIFRLDPSTARVGAIVPLMRRFSTIRNAIRDRVPRLIELMGGRSVIASTGLWLGPAAPAVLPASKSLAGSGGGVPSESY